ncbi:MAG TPA: amidohydrolase family protein [Acidimicrobiales bacterium]|nr:amidohydrolase family protein [Acidimicrobiales bacterium]
MADIERVFDFHVHVGATSEWIPEGLHLASELSDPKTMELLSHDVDGARVAAYLKGQGVTHAIAIPPGRRAVEEQTLSYTAASDGMLLPFVQYDPRAEPGARARFEAAIAAGARGLKVHPATYQLPPNDRALYPLYEVAERLRVPVLVHVGSSVFPGAKMRFCDPLLVDEVAADFPDLLLICAHAGRGFWTSQVYSLVRMRQNVWMELSGLPPKRLPEWFPELDRVRDKVVWGTDWPSSPPPSRLIAQMAELPYEAATIEAVMWGNAARLFGLA